MEIDIILHNLHFFPHISVIRECNALQATRLLNVLLVIFSFLSQSPVIGNVWLVSSEFHKPWMIPPQWQQLGNVSGKKEICCHTPEFLQGSSYWSLLILFTCSKTPNKYLFTVLGPNITNLFICFPFLSFQIFALGNARLDNGLWRIV